jgi:hypothetical protein
MTAPVCSYWHHSRLEGTDLKGLRLLIKQEENVQQIIFRWRSMVKIQGHLDNISNNMLIGAINYYNDNSDSVKNQLTGEYALCRQPKELIKPRDRFGCGGTKTMEKDQA